MDNNELLQAILSEVKSMKQSQNDTNQRLDTMQADINTLKTDVNTLKTDVNTLKTDVNTLKTDVNTLKTDVNILKTDVDTMKKDIEEIKENSTVTRAAVNQLIDWADDESVQPIRLTDKRTI